MAIKNILIDIKRLQCAQQADQIYKELIK